MSLRNAILRSQPTSYFPLDDPRGSPIARDECGLHHGVPPSRGVTFASVAFGASLVVEFDGCLGSYITIPDDPRYSHDHANALTVACWICPRVLDFEFTDGLTDQYVHFIEKCENSITSVEWAFRLYNHTNPERHSRSSFYFFNVDASPPHLGAGAYMEFGRSPNDSTPVEPNRWIFLVGQGEGYIDEVNQWTGARLYKQGVLARLAGHYGDRYNNPPKWRVHPRHGPGPIRIGGSPAIDAPGKTAFQGGIAHIALWNRLLEPPEVNEIFQAGRTDLGAQLTGRDARRSRSQNLD